MAAQFGRRLRRGATSGAVVAAAVAALAASQGPGAIPPPVDSVSGDRAIGTGDATTPPGGDSATGDSAYYTDLPPLNTPNRPGLPNTPGTPVVTGPAEAGIPATVLAAYRRAEQSIRASDPGCNLPWQLLAGIGKVESGQARGGRVDANGTTFSPILGPVLNGVGFANISDTDRGAFDGDTVHDRAVGPMQFIPSTWATWGQDANGDGKRDPNNIYDAAQAAGMYLCAGSRNLAVKADLDRAILSYNQSTEYLHTVLSWYAYYQRGTHTVPDGTGMLPVDRSDGGQGARPRPSHPLTPPTSPAPSPKPGTPTPRPSEPAPTVPPKVTPPTTPPVKPGPVVPPTLQVARIKAAASGLTAVTESTFATAPAVAALDASGKPVAGVSVRFEIVGTTDARFPGGASVVTVTSGPNGVALAPALRAGVKTGTFTVRATVPARTLPAVDLRATVEIRKADAFTPVHVGDLTGPTGTLLTQEVVAKATKNGVAAPGVLVTMVITDSMDSTAESADGPYFTKDAAGNPVRTWVATTNDRGVIALTELFAGQRPGTYVLLLTAPGGATLRVPVTVTAPEPTPTPTPTPTPSPAPSETTSPSASPSPSA